MQYVCENHVINALAKSQAPHIEKILSNTRKCAYCQNYAVFSLYVSSIWELSTVKTKGSKSPV